MKQTLSQSLTMDWITIVMDLWNWFLLFFGLHKKTSTLVTTVTEPKTITTTQNEYVTNRKKQFLTTFEKENVNWNANIDEIIKDAETLSKILEDPNNALEIKWKRTCLVENTPRGNIVMFYDLYKRAFSYYCDQCAVPYAVINAVAMKYVITFHCRDFFIDNSVLPKPILVPISTDSKVTSSVINREDTTKKADLPFVNFKSYNLTKPKSNENNSKIINCFLHLGPVRNWSPIQKSVKVNPINGFASDVLPPKTNNQKLSYKDFKKMTSSSEK